MPIPGIRHIPPRPLEHRSRIFQKVLSMLDPSIPLLIHHREPTTHTPTSNRFKCIQCLMRSLCTTTPGPSFPHHLHTFLLALHRCRTGRLVTTPSTLFSNINRSHLYQRLLPPVLQQLHRKVMGWFSTRLFQLGIQTSSTILRQLPQCLTDL